MKKNIEVVGVVIACLILAGGVVWFSSEPIIPTYESKPFTIADTIRPEPQLQYDAFGVLGIPCVLYLRNEKGDLVTKLETRDGFSWDGESEVLGGKCHLENVMERSRFRVDGCDVVDYQDLTVVGEDEPMAVYSVKGQQYALFRVAG